MKVISKKVHSLIQECLTKFLCNGIDFYYHYLQNVNFYEADFRMGTAAVGIYDMRLAFFYNSEFIESLTERELNFLVIHELYHLLNRHGGRGVGYKRDLANVAMDMIINYLILKHHGNMADMLVYSKEKIDKEVEKLQKLANEGKIELKEDLSKMYESVGKNQGVVLDPNYKGELMFEPLYDWLQQEHQKHKNGGKNELSQETKDLLDNVEKQGMSMDYHGDLDEVEQEIKDQLSKEAVERAKMSTHKSRGNLAGGLEEVLNLLLAEPKTNNLKLVKTVISSLKGRMKDKSYRRLNRRVPGIKGKVKLGLEINCILDTSGSMGNEFDLVLSEIFRDGYTINMVQIDTCIQKVHKIKNKHEIGKMPIKGHGGTCLYPAIEYLMDPANKLTRFGTVILTDGYTDSWDFKGSPQQFLVLTTDAIPNISNAPNVKVIKIKS